MLTWLFVPISFAISPKPEVHRLSDDLVVRAVADGVWLHTSTKLIASYGRVPSNGLIVRTHEGLVMVDTAWNDAQTQAILDWTTKQLGSLPISLIVTHAHDDKMGGMTAAHKAGIPSYALEATNQLAPTRDLLPATHGITLAAGETKSFAGGEVVVLFPGAGHTIDNTVVYVPSAKLLHGGCLIRAASTDSLGNTADGDVGSWASSVSRVRDAFSEARQVVPSHGEPGGVELLDHTIALVHATKSEN